MRARLRWITGPAGLPAQLAHRLTQPRRKRKVVPLEWAQVGSYAELLRSRSPSLLWLPQEFETHGANVHAGSELLFPELASQEIIDSHHLVPSRQARLGLGCLSNVLVSGQSLVGRSWLLYRLAPLVPSYVDDHLSRGLPVGDRKITRKQRRAAPEATVLVTHWNSGVYGHWLLEGMPKLLLLRDMARHLPPLRIALPASLGSWVSAWIARLLPEATIDTYDDRKTYLECRTLLVPTLMVDPDHHFFHPEFGRLLVNVAPPLAPSGRRTRLYVSRVAANSFRRLSNQAEIEAIATSEGLELVRPETLSVAEQIDVFARAELIVGEFGSAMHNSIFSPPGTTVFCLNWINGLQSRIAELKQQRVAYLLPSDGVPVKFVEHGALQTYHIDPLRFRQYLRKLLSR
jgi:Glycosyltransferase 61